MRLKDFLEKKGIYQRVENLTAKNYNSRDNAIIYIQEDTSFSTLFVFEDTKEGWHYWTEIASQFKELSKHTCPNCNGTDVLKWEHYYCKQCDLKIF